MLHITYEVEIKEHKIVLKYSEKLGRHVIMVDEWYYIFVDKKNLQQELQNVITEAGLDLIPKREAA